MSGWLSHRAPALPRLGLGISTEFGARHGGLDLARFRQLRPDLVQFLEIGIDLERGLDEDARGWVGLGLPTTYHFLDVNLEEPEDLDPDWIRDAGALAHAIGAAWFCGDAGLWHVGPRDRGHGTLMPPVLVPESADAVAESVRRLREATGLDVFPENPPAHAWAGPMHVLDYFARVAERADTGLLLDAAHVAVFQHVRGHAPLDAFDGFPFERIVEMHVAGGRPFEHGGATFIEDDHGTHVLAATWEILEHVLPRATNLKAVVVEAERNAIEDVIPIFERVAALLPWNATGAMPVDSGDREAPATRRETNAVGTDHRRLQRALFRTQHDARFAAAVIAREGDAVAATGLGPADLDLLIGTDIAGVTADPGGKRAAQFLRNTGAEFALSVARARTTGADAGLIDTFVSTPRFHRCIDRNERLPLALGEHAVERAERTGDGTLVALARLELVLARARRGDFTREAPSPGEIVLAARAEVVTQPEGLLAAAAAMRRALDEGVEVPPGAAANASRTEQVLVSAEPATSPHRLREVSVELLSGLAGAWLLELRTPQGAAGVGAFCAAHDASREELGEFIDSLETEGLIVRGA